MWPELSRKMYVSKPTELTRADLWELLFLTKQRVNPWHEREYQGADRDEVYDLWRQEQRYMDACKVITFPFCINVGVALAGFNIDNVAATKALKDAKTRHVRRWQTKEGTYRIKNMVPPDVRDTGDVVMVDTAAFRS